MDKPIILIGGGGHCKSVINTIESINREIAGILDLPVNIGKKCLNYTIVGSDKDIPKYIDEYEFIITLGYIKNADIRTEIFKKIKLLGGTLATIIAKSAIVSRYAKIGEGTVILNQACVNASAEIGCNCIINTMANIEHDSIVGDGCHISTGCLINGGVKVGKYSFMGSGSIVCQGLTIAEKTIIGAGGVVCSSIYHSGTYVGVPVKKIK
ncbi:MAG: acetyltransferase [Bacteroidales bacterium]|nr:acetyltransferase [Bacteroidales bacterium]